MPYNPRTERNVLQLIVPLLVRFLLKKQTGKPWECFFVCCMRLQWVGLVFAISLCNSSFLLHTKPKKTRLWLHIPKGGRCKDLVHWLLILLFVFGFRVFWRAGEKLQYLTLCRFLHLGVCKTCFWLLIVCFGFVVSLSDHVKTHGKMQVSLGEA